MDILFNSKTFKQKLKLYKDLPINDHHVFNAIKITIGEKEGSLSTLLNTKTIIDENLLSKNENDIAHKLSSIKGNKGYFPVYKKLQEKFKEYKKLVEDYDRLLVLFRKYNGVNIDNIHQKYTILTNKLVYSLIELKVNLKLDLHDISNFDIMWYCMLMYNDIVSSNYETLSINKHLDSETGDYLINKLNVKRKTSCQ